MVNIEMYCATCGAAMCSNATSQTPSSFSKNEPTFEIEPCEVCLQQVRDEGHTAGYDEGYQEARDQFEVT